MARPATMFFWKGRGYATDAGGRRTVLVKGSRTRANHALAVQRLAKLLNGEPLDSPAIATAAPEVKKVEPKAGERTVADVIEFFLADCAARVQAGELKPNTLNLYYLPYGKWLQSELGKLPFAQLTTAAVRTYRAELVARQLRSNTVRNHLTVLRTIMRWAGKQGLTDGMTLPNIPCPPRCRRELIPNADEIQRLLDAAVPDVRDVLETLLNVAVRPGDCYALRRKDIDLVAGFLRLADSKTGPRLVCLVPRVADILIRRLQTPGDPDDFVFLSPRGRPWTIQHFASMVRDARQRAGLGSHATAYSVRHAWTTNAFLNGLALADVRALRGDANVATTVWYEHIAAHLSHLKRAACRAVGLQPLVTEQRTSPDRSDES